MEYLKIITYEISLVEQVGRQGQVEKNSHQHPGFAEGLDFH